MKTVLALLVLASTSHAYPVFVAEDEPRPEPVTKLGFRIGFGSVPIANATALGAVSLAIGTEHEVFGVTRMFAEYEGLWLHEPGDPESGPAFSGTGHRTHLGLRRALASKALDNLRFYVDGEAGGGLALLDTPAGAAVMPHALVGLRAGYQLKNSRALGSRVFEPELHVRAIVVEHGIGFGGGLGFWWGD